MHAYEYPIWIDLAKAVPTFGGLLDSINNTMNGFGFEERLVARGPGGVVTVTSNRELTEDEQETIRQELQKATESKGIEVRKPRLLAAQ